MRDRLVALGMRRPTRVKDEDYDVPMLTEDDFEIAVLPVHIDVIGPDCSLVRDVEAQRELAQMCIAKAKLCLCISHVLSAQYSVLVRHQGMQGQEGSTRSSVMLFPKKLDQTDEVKACDEELSTWVAELPPSCTYSAAMPSSSSGPSIFVQRSLLHMVYYTTLSALHRPQVLPSATTTSQPDSSRSLQDLSRKKVREASREITRISTDLHTLSLEKYLPTTGVTVLLPAIIIHLLDIKSCNDEARAAAMDGFCQCMLVLEKLRDNYASADFATQFLEAAIRKADIDIVVGNNSVTATRRTDGANIVSDKVREMRERERAARRTPPVVGEERMFRPDMQGSGMMDIGIPVHRPSLSTSNSYHADPTGLSNGNSKGLHTLAARTPPDSDTMLPSTEFTSHQSNHGQNTNPNHSNAHNNVMDLDFPGGQHANFAGDVDLSDFLVFQGDGSEIMWNVALDEGAHGESGGFMGDMNWIEQAPGWSRLNTPGEEEGAMFGEGAKREIESVA